MNKLTVILVLLGLLVAMSACMADAPTPEKAQASSPASSQNQAPSLRDVYSPIVFIFDGNKDSIESVCSAPHSHPLATGFLLSISGKDRKTGELKSAAFVITTRHVLLGSKKFVVRFNKEDGGSAAIEYLVSPVKTKDDVITFIYPSGNVDLLAFHIQKVPAGCKPKMFDASLVIASEAEMEALDIQEGTNIFTIGNLTDIGEQSRNLPVYRFGRIALIRKGAWFKSPNSSGLEEGYLVELQASRGMSGAPILIEPQQVMVRPGKPPTIHFRYLDPLILGVQKAAVFSDASEVVGPSGPTGSFAMTRQGISIVEPAKNLRDFVESLADMMRKDGLEIVFPSKTAINP